MQIIKLDAINSTNDFLKQLAKEKPLENFTVVTANEQINGKGQMGAKWVSEKGKNLTMSVLFQKNNFCLDTIFDLNVIVAVSILEVLQSLKIDDCFIKWPNDIMAGNKKIAGILIENTIKSNNEIVSIIGIGINVNQVNFGEIMTATSIINQTGFSYTIDEILIASVSNLEQNINSFLEESSKAWEKYHQNLFRKDVSTTFEEKKGNKFIGIIKSVSKKGQLLVLMDNNVVCNFGIKEIKMLL